MTLFRNCVLTIAALAATQAVRLEFEVASIKVDNRNVPWQDTRDNCGLNGMGSVNLLPGGRLRVERALLSCIIQGAYSIRAFQVIGGPDWIDSLHFDIDAKASNANSSSEQIRNMLQTLLADRFRMRLHKETRQLPVYVLTIAGNGSKLRPTRPGGCLKPGSSAGPSLPAPPAAGRAPDPPIFPCGRMGGIGSPGGSRMDGGDVPISELVRLLTNQLHRPVIDNTGLKGTFDIHLAYSGTNPLSASSGGESAVDSGPTLFEALQQQLGLKLQASKGPTEVIVLDSVQKPVEN